MKYLGIYLQHVQDLCVKITLLIKEVKEDANQQRGLPYSWIGRLSIVEMSTIPNWSIGLMQFLSKFQKSFFLRHRQAYSKIYIRRHRP